MFVGRYRIEAYHKNEWEETGPDKLWYPTTKMIHVIMDYIISITKNSGNVSFLEIE